MRQDPTMTSMAKSLSDTDIANIAAYFSSLPRDRN
jgi:cytochrome c553